MAEEIGSRATDVVGEMVKSHGIPTPEQIKADSATVVAVALAEERLSISMVDASFWQGLLALRGGTNIATLLWAYVNQHVVADGHEPLYTERQVQAAMPASRMLDYIEALARAYGQDEFAGAFGRLRRAQREVVSAPSGLIGEDGTSRPTVSGGTRAVRPRKDTV